MFRLSFLLLGWFISFAVNAHWVIDEHQLIHEKVNQKIERILQESAENRDLYVKVLLVGNTNYVEMVQYANKESAKWHGILLVIDVSTNQSLTLLGNNINRTSSLQNSLSIVHTKIIQPALNRGNLEKALLEGVIAITTVMQDGGSFTQKAHSSIHMRDPIKWALWIIFLSIIFMILQGYLRRPPWIDEAVDLQKLEERMLLNCMRAQARNDRFEFDRLMQN